MSEAVIESFKSPRRYSSEFNPLMFSWTVESLTEWGPWIWPLPGPPWRAWDHQEILHIPWLQVQEAWWSWGCSWPCDLFPQKHFLSLRVLQVQYSSLRVLFSVLKAHCSVLWVHWKVHYWIRLFEGVKTTSLPSTGRINLNCTVYLYHTLPFRRTSNINPFSVTENRKMIHSQGFSKFISQS